MPRGTNAPNDWPAEPVNVRSMVPSGSPSPPYFLVTSWPRMVPTVRLTLRIAHLGAHRLAAARSPAGASGTSSVTSSDFSSPWSCCLVRCRSWSGNAAQVRLVQDRRQVETGGLPVVDRLRDVERADLADRLVEACGSPSSARYSRTSSAMNSKKLTTCSALPV